MSEFLPAPDEITLTIGSTTLGPWQSVAVMCSVEMFPRSFSFTASEPFPDDASKIVAQPGAPCTVTCGTQTLITGYVDSLEMNVAAREHVITVQGRGKCCDLVDCSADLLSSDSGIVGGMVNAANTLDLAQRLCKPFGITARSVPTDLGKAIPAFQAALGESPYEITERSARYAGFLIYEDANGALVLDQVGKSEMASGFTIGGSGGNVEQAHAMLAINERFSVYTVVWTTMAQLGEISPLGNQRAVAYDNTVTRNRPKIIVSEQISPDQDLGQARANWEFARRYGRSQAITLTCDSWRDSANNLWEPNKLATVNAPSLKLINAKWIIASVTFRKDPSGTHADIVLMPPAAFSPEPIALQLFDRELTQAVPSSQSPASSGGDPQQPSGGP